MIQKYIIDKTDVHDLLTGKDLPLSQVPQGSRARAFCVEIAGNLTNGDVIKALFPNAKFDNACPFSDGRWEIMPLNTDVYKPTQLRTYKDWWNAPYKTESEG